MIQEEDFREEFRIEGAREEERRILEVKGDIGNIKIYLERDYKRII